MKKLLFILIILCSLQGFGQIKGYWRLNGNSNDASGNGLNGTDTDITYSLGNGRLNQGAGGNGTSSLIRIGTGSYYTTFTLSAWVFIKSFANYNFIVIRGNGNLRNYSLDIRKTTGKVCFGFTTASMVYQELESTVSIGLNKWVHVVGIYNGTKFLIYLNGVLNNERSMTLTPSNIGDLYIGALNNGASSLYFFNGAIDEIIIDNTEWSPAKIKNYYILCTSPSY